MIRALRTLAFGLMEGVRLYLEVASRAPSESGDPRRQVRPVGAELVRGVESGGG